MGTITPRTSLDGRYCMSLVHMDIHTIAVGGGVVPSLIVLTTHPTDGSDPIQLPIRIGTVEATAISMGIEGSPRERPMTHDLFKSVIESLNAHLDAVAIVDVHGTTFYAQLFLKTESGEALEIDCRPSDAIALAVRFGAPILVDEQALNAATLPDFKGVERTEKQQELERFHDFVESLSPSDFSE